MKKLLLFVLLLSFCGKISAQFKKGDWQISAGATFDFTKTNMAKTEPVLNIKEKSPYSYKLFPSVEYFTTDRLSIGIAPFWGESSYEYSIGPQALRGPEFSADCVGYKDLYIKDWGAEVFAKYYLPIAPKFYLTFKGHFGYAHAKSKDREVLFMDNIESTDFTGSMLMVVVANLKSKSIFAGVTPGAAYYPHKRWGIHLQFLPFNYLNDRNRKEKDMFYAIGYRYGMSNVFENQEPEGVFPNDGTEIRRLDYRFQRRKNKFDINWRSITISASHKF